MKHQWHSNLLPLTILAGTLAIPTHPAAAAVENKFQPKAGFARKWTKLGKEAGCRDIVFTTKHPEGFGLLDSNFGDYNAGKILLDGEPEVIPDIKKP